MNKSNIGRIILGIFYLISCLANLIFQFLLNYSHNMWAVCLENVRFSFYRELLVQIIIPNEKLVILLIVVFELIVGVLILSKGISVKIGLILGILWVLNITPFLPLGDVFAHLILGLLQALLLMGNYDTTFLEIIQSKIQSESITPP